MPLSELGPKRKYYFTTPLGVEVPKEMTIEWRIIYD